MDTQHLKTFVEVVRQGSFAGAARQLDLAPSAVTRAVAALETQLGARLLQRTTRKVALTEAGEQFVQRLRPLLDELEHAADEVRSSAAQMRGTVRLTASVAFGQQALMPLLPALHERHPGLELELLFSDDVVDLRAQRVDLALRLGPAVDPSLVGLRLRSVRYRVVASPAWIQANGKPRVPADLADCQCLRFALPGFRTDWLFRQAGAVETVGVRGWLVASNALALRRGALDGLGPTLLGDWLIDPDLRAGALVDLFPKHEATATNFDSAVWLLYPAREHLPRRVRTVVDFLKTALQGR
jgi:DNA-binding transcriptional LysR family regulator